MGSTIGFEESYLGQLRKLVGNRKLIVPTARAGIPDVAGRVVLIRRRDNRRWGLPAGTIELDESILDCLKREVKEETGLSVLSATAIAIYSEPRFAFTAAYGGEHQAFAIVFVVNQWEGELLGRTDETIDADFFDLGALPESLSPVHREALADWLHYDRQLILK